MSETTIRVAVEVDGASRSLILYGDPEDALLAVRLGQAIAAAVLEMGTERTHG